MIQRMLAIWSLVPLPFLKGIHRRKVFLSLFPERQNDLVESRGLSTGSAILWSWIGALGVLKYVHKLRLFKKYSWLLYSCELSDCFLMNRTWQSVVAWHSRWRCKRHYGFLPDSIGLLTLGTVAAMLRGHSSSPVERSSGEELRPPASSHGVSHLESGPSSF